jgi:ureidoglycolate hydrolase
MGGFGETPQYEMVKRVWEKWVLFLIQWHPQKHPTPLLEIDPHPLSTQLNE